MLTLSNHHYLAVYKKVKSPVFERLMLYVRTKNNEGEMVEANSAMKRIAQLRDRQNAVLMVADQTPRGVETDYWNVFLHQETCWFTGLEHMAKMLDYAVVFVAMKRVERSRYEVTFHLITDEPAKTEKGFIMESYARCTERSILDQPDNWLWSHRRWKHQRKHNEA